MMICHLKNKISSSQISNIECSNDALKPPSFESDFKIPPLWITLLTKFWEPCFDAWRTQIRLNQFLKKNPLFSHKTKELTRGRKTQIEFEIRISKSPVHSSCLDYLIVIQNETPFSNDFEWNQLVQKLWKLSLLDFFSN